MVVADLVEAAALRGVLAIKARRTQRGRTERPSFRAYLDEAWSVVEPATPFVTGYHVDAIVEHLEAISRGDLLNLVINIPPRHSKSSLVSVLWPTWEWIDAPHLRYLCVSYGADLSARDSTKRRRVIMSPWYQQRWGDRYRLTGDMNAKTRFENDRTGVMIATSVGGVGTGEGGQRVIVDDPHSARQAESDTYRQSALDWWDGTMATRADQPHSTARVIVMQRLHERDLTGHILDLMKDGGTPFDHLVLPAEYEPRVQVCVADLVHDPRTQEGALLSPERFDADTLRMMKISLGDRAAGQLQQRPAPAGGGIYRRDWWAEGRARFDATDAARQRAVLGRWLCYDTAMKDTESNDYSACVVLELEPDYRLAVRHVWRQHLAFPDLVEAIRADAVRWNFDDKLRGVVIEDKNSGTSAVQTLRAAADPTLAPLIFAFTPIGSKPARGRQAAVWCAESMLELPHPSDAVPWLFDFEEELFTFPNGAHDDQADALAMGLIYLEHYLAQGLRARLTTAQEAA